MKFYIYKVIFSDNTNPDISFVPALARRRLSEFNRIAAASMHQCYEEGANIVFATDYGDIKNLINIVNQYKTDGEISPVGFSNSVLNASVGFFSLLNKIIEKYNVISANETSFSSGLADAILEDKKTLFTYVQTKDKIQSVSILIGKEKRNKAIKCELILEEGENSADEFTDFKNFMNRHIKEFQTEYYKIKILSK